MRAARARLAAGIALVLAAVACGLVLARVTAATAPVLAAARVLRAGDVLGLEDLKTVQARLAGEQAALVVGPGDIDAVVGLTLGREVQAGALIERGSLLRARGDTRLVSFALARSDAVGGSLGPGDVVDVVATTGAGAGACTRVAVAGIHVAAAGAAPGRTRAATDDDGIEVTVDVDAAEAVALTHALATAHVVLVLATGAPPATAGPLGDCDRPGGGP